jgi:hypothetical protein
MTGKAENEKTILVYKRERAARRFAPLLARLAMGLCLMVGSLAALALPAPSPIPSPNGQSAPERSPTAAAPGRTPAAVATKSATLERLRELQARQTQVINNIDNMVRKKLSETTSISLKGTEAKTAERKIEQLAQSLDELDVRRREFAARREFLDQLIFQVDTKWTNEPLPVFLEHALLNIALNDLGEAGAADPSSDARLWKFATFMSIAVRELIEPREDAITFVEGYMNFTSVTDPKPPSEFIASRAYTNGSASAAARPVDRERLGDDLDRKLKQLQSGATSSASSAGAGSASPNHAPIEIRLPSAELEPRKGSSPSSHTSPPAAVPSTAKPAAGQWQ